MKRKLKGSLTIFLSLILVSVMTLIFTMAECIRLYEMHDFAQEYTDMAVESAFSEYNPYLWANYRILAVDLGYGTDAIGPAMLEQKTLDYCRYNSNIEYGNNYARLLPASCSAKQYSLLTDESGQGVIMLGTKAAMDGMAAQVISSVQGNIDEVGGVEIVPVEEKTQSGKDSLENAKRELEEAKEAAANDDDPNTNPGDYPDPGEVEDDPLDAFGIMKESFSKGVLATVVDAEGLSDKQVNLDSLPSHRSLYTGNGNETYSPTVADKALFIDYLLTNYSYYGMDRKHAGMQYELEYLISGKETDTQSLAAVVEQLMIIRESANYMTIIKSPSLVAQAQAIAEILAGFTMNPAIIEAVKYAIIGAWAYVESTLDIRLLLAGGKEAVIKSTEQWTSDVWHLSACFDVKTKAKECPGGIGYKEYLMTFLALKSNENLAMRACDVMETALHGTEDYKNVRCDNMIFAGNIEIGFEAEEMFLSLFTGGNSTYGYSLTKSKSLSY